MVPKKHGFQVCQEIKASQIGRRTPVLITTAFYRGRKHRSEAQRSYGCDDYLEKPIAEDLLLSTCRRFLIDTQEPPIPLEPIADDASVELDPAPQQDEPQAARPDPPSRKLAALDDLSDDEIQARLDALLRETGATDDAMVPTRSPEGPEGQPLEPVLEHDFGFDDAEPALAAPAGEIDQPEFSVEPETLPEIVFEAADPPAIDSSESEPFELPSIPPLQLEIQPPAAEAVGEGAVAQAPVEVGLEVETEQDAEPRTAIAALAPFETETTAGEPPPTVAADPDSGPLEDSPPLERPAKSRLPLWIGVASAACLVAGGGLLFFLPGEADPEPIEVARRTDTRRPAAPAGSGPLFANPSWESHGSDPASPGEPGSAANDPAPTDTTAESSPPLAAPARREDPPPVAATEKSSPAPAAASVSAPPPVVAADREDRPDPGSVGSSTSPAARTSETHRSPRSSHRRVRSTGARTFPRPSHRS